LVASGFQERIDSPLSRSVALEELATHDLRLVASRYVRTASQSSPYPMVALHELARIRREQVNPAGLGNDNVVCLGLEHVTSKTGELVSPTGEPASALRSVKTRFLPGDILYGKLRPYLAKVVRAEFAAIATTEFVVLEVVDSRADPEYLVRTMRSPEFTEAATALMVGANHPRISPKDLMSIEIPLPPLEVQSRIADSAMRMEERARQRRVEADGLSRTADALVASVWTQEPDWP
jgi:type I restriction enzyme S subunit